MDETRNEVVFFAQKDLFEQQAAKLISYVSNSDNIDTSIDKGSIKLLATSNVFDDAFQSRFPGRTNNTNSTSVLDDTDMSLLRILDGDGYISQNVNMDAFITLMNRSIDDNKFRTLMLDILSVYTTQECQLHFVQNGGYKILKNWLVTAFKAGNVDELTAILYLCLHLPFDKKAITEADIGKKIKELKSSKHKDVLSVPVNSLMESWRAQNNKNKSTTVSAPPRATSSTEDSKVNLSKDRVQQFLNVLNKDFYNAVPAIKTSTSIDPSNNINITNTNVNPTSSITSSSIDGNIKKTPVLSEVTHSSSSMAVEKNISPTSKGAKRKVDMAAIARNLAANSTDSISSTASSAEIEDSNKLPATTGTQGSSSADGMEDASVLPHRAGIFPSKSCLKKPTNTNSKSKCVITWADREGGNLREIQTFEIDKPKGMRSTEGYNTSKSHREREKRERMMEKAVQTNKKKDAMQRSVEWEIPGALKFELLIVDNCHNEVSSEAVNIQNKRVESVLEARYMDESLIPQDPGVLEGKDGDVCDSNSVTKVVNVSFQIGVIRDVDAPGMPQIPGIGGSNGPPSMPSIGNMVGAPMPPVGAVPPPINPLYTAVPPQFHGLEPALLQRISQDESLMFSLLNPDGSLNERQIALLRMQSQQNAVMSAPSFQAHPGMAPPPPIPQFNGGPPPGGIGGMSMPLQPPQYPHPQQQGGVYPPGMPLPPPGNGAPPTLRVPAGPGPPGAYPGPPIPPTKKARR